MARSHTEEPSHQMARTAEEHRIDIGPLRFSCLSSGLASVVSGICIGLAFGIVGGLLLGSTAVAVLQCLEILADNRPLMDNLVNYALLTNLSTPLKNGQTSLIKTYISLTDGYPSLTDSDGDMAYRHISILAQEFGVISSTLSLPVGISVGLAACKRVIKKHGEAAMAKALSVAGLVCLMIVTATGCAVGPMLELILSINLNFDVLVWLYEISLLGLTCMPLCFVFCFCFERHTCIMHMSFFLLSCVFTVVCAIIASLFSFFSRSRLLLMGTLAPAILFERFSGENLDFHLTIAPVPLMLMITDVFVIARKPIIVLQTSVSTSTSSDVLESIFVGILSAQMLMVAIGMSLFLSWQRGGAGKISAGAFASGMTVFGAIKFALAVLGPGRSIGALIGVTGAVGVCLSAAGAVADRYGRAAGLGVTLGAATGAFLASCAHSGLSGVFMALCAAVISGGLYLQRLVEVLTRPHIWHKFKLCLYIVTPITLLIWLYFTYTPFFVYLIFCIFGACISFVLMLVMICLFAVCCVLFCLLVLFAFGILYAPFIIIGVITAILIECIFKSR